MKTIDCEQNFVNPGYVGTMLLFPENEPLKNPREELVADIEDFSL